VPGPTKLLALGSRMSGSLCIHFAEARTAIRQLHLERSSTAECSQCDLCVLVVWPSLAILRFSVMPLKVLSLWAACG
jgi:hypothetical protein